jgi:hypothetical protein
VAAGVTSTDRSGGTSALDREAVLARAGRAGDWLAARDYRSWDPYDGLQTPLARLPGVRHHAAPRFALQQVVKRSPVNLRPMLRIAPGRNPVTLALAAQGRAYLARADPARAGEHTAVAHTLVAELAALRSTGWSGSCWGYDFDWQSRRVSIPAGCPTIVATGMVTNALFEVDRLLGNPDARTLVLDALRFVTEDLQRTEDGDGGFCWSYSPHDRMVVHNATMKGARLCAQVAMLTGDPGSLELARRTVAFVLRHQRPDGSWPYSEGDDRTWADNFHTGYVLDAMLVCSGAGLDGLVGEGMRLGFDFYRRSFFGPDGAPILYPGRPRPIDATACAQSILTLCAFGDAALAARAAAWTIANLSNPDGSFAYQLGRRRLDRTPFARWSVSWMFCGLSRVALALGPH